MKKSLSTLAVLSALVASTSAFASNEVNVYSYRQVYLIEPILKNFEKDTGIKVNTIFADKGLLERVQKEGELSPADVLLTVDISRLMQIVNAGLAQKVDSKVLEKNIPAQFRDSNGEWFGLTKRARVIYTSKERVGALPAGFDYLDLAKPEYKGKICVRSGKNAYNLSLFAAMVEHYGEANTKAFLEGLKANLARKPQGNDRNQVQAIKEGVCDYSLGNSYYYGKMLEDEKQRSWAEAAVINFPAGAHGTHFNISGVAVAKHAPNKANAVKLIEYLSGDKAQALYAELNHEYPVKADISPSKIVKEWGSYSIDAIKLEDIAKNHKTALKLLDEVKFDDFGAEK